MTNFEKYREEIEKLKNKYSFTLDLDGNVADCNNIPCCNCKFQDFATCKNSRINWLFKEYEEFILSDDELELIKAINKVLGKEIKYMTRDEGNIMRFFETKPKINGLGNYYSLNECSIHIDVLNGSIFPSIQHKDGLYDIENKCFIKE